MTDSTRWEEVMKARKSIQLEFGVLSLKKDALEKELKRVLATVFSKACNPELGRINITVKEDVIPGEINDVKHVDVSVGEYLDTASKFHFWDCEGEYVYNEIKEALSKCGVKFVRDDNDPKIKWWMLSIELLTE